MYTLRTLLMSSWYDQSNRFLSCDLFQSNRIMWFFHWCDTDTYYTELCDFFKFLVFSVRIRA